MEVPLGLRGCDEEVSQGSANQELPCGLILQSTGDDPTSSGLKGVARIWFRGGGAPISGGGPTPYFSPQTPNHKGPPLCTFGYLRISGGGAGPPPAPPWLRPCLDSSRPSSPPLAARGLAGRLEFRGPERSRSGSQFRASSPRNQLSAAGGRR